MNDPPPGLIPVPLGKACVLLLTEQEYIAAIRRGKAWRRREALMKRTVSAAPSSLSPSPTRR